MEGMGKAWQADSTRSSTSKYYTLQQRLFKAIKGPLEGSSISKSLPGILIPENKTRGNLIFDSAANDTRNQDQRESL